MFSVTVTHSQRTMASKSEAKKWCQESKQHTYLHTYITFIIHKFVFRCILDLSIKRQGRGKPSQICIYGYDEIRNFVLS